MSQHFPRILVRGDEVCVQWHARGGFHVLAAGGSVEERFAAPSGVWALYQPHDVAFSEGHEMGFYEGRKNAA